MNPLGIVRFEMSGCLKSFRTEKRPASEIERPRYLEALVFEKIAASAAGVIGRSNDDIVISRCGRTVMSIRRNKRECGRG